MKFGAFSDNLKEAFRELANGLTKLSLDDNFQGFSAEVIIPAASELAIRNQLGRGLIPTKRLIVRQSGDGLITDGVTSWTENFVYLYNNGAVPVTATVIFLR